MPPASASFDEARPPERGAEGAPASCPNLGAHLRHAYDPLCGAPLPDRLAELAAALGRVCAARAGRGFIE